MMNNLWTKLFLTTILGLGVALYGCPPTTPADDDDDDDNDDAGDDDGGDDDMGDDDGGDDDGGDDDAGGDHVQSLAGVTSSNGCPDCDYTFDITFSTIAGGGSQYAMADGVYTMAYDSDWVYNEGTYPVILYYSSGWNFWYSAYPGQGGHTLEISYASYGQYGYWDVDGGSMTGQITNTM